MCYDSGFILSIINIYGYSFYWKINIISILCDLKCYICFRWLKKKNNKNRKYINIKIFKFEVIVI